MKLNYLLGVFILDFVCGSYQSSHEFILPKIRKTRHPDEETQVKQAQEHNKVSTTTTNRPNFSQESTSILKVNSVAKTIACFEEACQRIKDYTIDTSMNINCHHKFIEIVFELKRGLGTTKAFLTPEKGILSRVQKTQEAYPRIKR